MAKNLMILIKEIRKKIRGQPDLNQGPLDLQWNALPLIYTPTYVPRSYDKNTNFK